MMETERPRGGLTDPGVALFVQIVAVMAGLAAGMWAGYVLIGVRWDWTNHQYTSPRYADVGGAFLALIDGGLAMLSGGWLGVRAATMLSRFVVSGNTENRDGFRRLVLVAIDCIATLLLIYITYVANFLELPRG